MGVLFGGRSAELPVSVLSARQVVAALGGRFDVVPLGIGRDGSLHLGGGFEDVAARLAAGQAGVPFLSAEAAAALKGLDALFPVLHGPYGEDGSVQGFLETVGVPYVGSGVLASAVGMDKAMMKLAFGGAGLPQVPWRLVRSGDFRRDPEGVLVGLGEIGPPWFVKPANMGSSIGIAKAERPAELLQALEQAFAYDARAVVEHGLDGARELECGVVEEAEPEASAVGEVVVRGRPFYDYAAKYEDETTEIVVPARLTKEVAERVRALAVRAFAAVDARDFARVDFFLTGETVFVNEINTIPGFTPSSMFPKVWEASGVPFAALVGRLVERALARRAVRPADARHERRTP